MSETVYEIDPVIYEPGDEVIRFDKDKDKTGLNWYYPQVIEEVKMITSGDIRFQLIKIKGTTTWFPSLQFRPASDDFYNEIRDDYKAVMYKKGRKISKAKKETKSKLPEKNTGTIVMRKPIEKSK